MAKVGGALMEGYWPRGIPRTVPVPQRPLPALVKKGPKSAQERPALVDRSGTLTYGELAERIEALSTGLKASGVTSVAIAEANLTEGLVALLGALHAGCQATLLDLTAPSDLLGAWIGGARADAVLTACDAVADRDDLPVRVLLARDLEQPPEGSSRPARAAYDQAVVWLPSGKGVKDLSGHSHFTLSAMATNLRSFLPHFDELALLATGPVWQWETLVPALAHLIAGQVVAAHGAAGAPEAGHTYVILERSALEGLLDDPDAAGILRTVRHLFVQVGTFAPDWRKALERELGRPVLPLWGSPDVGPVIAAHPNWFPLPAHGIPLVNVTPVPLNPLRGFPSEVPWWMLDQAELGIDAPSTLVDCSSEERLSHVRVGNAVRTGHIVEVDLVGVIRFLSEEVGNGSR